ncbi:hypothetical protein E5226_13100 [Cellulomonas shaoxiangyii]|nr:hypothetical protein E5226_13100 [Cellulomonas shaoxiangyii]
MPLRARRDLRARWRRHGAPLARWARGARVAHRHPPCAPGPGANDGCEAGEAVLGAGPTRRPGVATSRTGTATYLRNRRRVLAEARRGGLTHCPGYARRDGSHRGCGRELDYDTPLLAGSAETDHVVEHKHGGGDGADNLRVLCRTCNQERNHERVPVNVARVEDFPTSRAW